MTGDKRDAFPDRDTAFPCPLTRAGFCRIADLPQVAGPEGKKVNILHDCWERCHSSDYFYSPEDGHPVAYCTADFMGERELISGRKTRDN
jgi:hypothetical protein